MHTGGDSRGGYPSHVSIAVITKAVRGAIYEHNLVATVVSAHLYHPIKLTYIGGPIAGLIISENFTRVRRPIDSCGVCVQHSSQPICDLLQSVIREMLVLVRRTGGQ